MKKIIVLFSILSMSFSIMASEKVKNAVEQGRQNSQIEKILPKLALHSFLHVLVI